MRRIFLRPLSLSIAPVVLMLAGVATAHPKLVSTSPAHNATVMSPARIQLRFSEKLVPAFSRADLAMASAKGGAATKIAAAAAMSPDGHALVVTPKRSLRAGRYTVSWRVVSTDTHRVAGSYAFAVK